MMFKEARILKIKEMIQNQNQVDVKSLSELLEVSIVTIRNDLEQLENEGFLYRTHGGAILRTPGPVQNITHNTYGTSFTFQFSDDVLHIAELAANHIKDNEWIFLGGGSTCCAIASAMKDRSVKVVTNNMLAALLLCENPFAQVMMIGGHIHNDSFPFIFGKLTTENLKDMFFQKTLYGVSGIDIKYGYSVSDTAERDLFQCLQKRSREIIIAADASKCDKTAFLSLGALDSVNTFITSDTLPQTYRDYYNDHTVNLLI